MKAIFYLAIATLVILFSACQTEDIIKDDARRASVQTVFHIPVLKVSYTTPLPSEEDINREKLEEELEKLREEVKDKIKKEIEQEIGLLKEDKYESIPTTIEQYGVEPPSFTMIPIGILLKDEEDFKFLDRVIVACEVEKTNIREWEKEYEKDILTISEVANVSPTAAKEIISKLRSSGYSVSKEEIIKSSDVKLLWYRYGWESYPETLDWKVFVEGTEDNIIIGYQDGIIETRPVPNKKRVYVKAQYFALKSKFKKKSDDVKRLEGDIEEKQKEIKRLEDVIKEKDKELESKEEKKKRSIQDVTLYDLMVGNIKLEELWFTTAASGIYIGDTRVAESFQGYSWPRGWFVFRQTIETEFASCVLTNAHVANLALTFSIYISEDEEIMWIQYPGIPFIRYTSASDYFGTPASVLHINQEPVSSYGFDSAIMVTTPVSSMKSNQAILGDSDNIREGEKVVMVGNPSLLQKFTTVGTISNTSYNMLDGYLFQYISKYLDKNPMLYNFLKSSSLWFDTPIGTGGTSGSGVWALSGKEKGKIIAIHNIGMTRPCSTFMISSELKEVKTEGLSMSRGGLIKDVVKTNMTSFIDKEGYKTAKYNTTLDEFVKENQSFRDLLEKSGCSMEISGLNGGIPINLVKQYLEEMGLNPEEFGWNGLSKDYYLK